MKKWTERETEYLCCNYGVLACSEIAKNLSRTIESVMKKAGHVGITKSKNPVSVGDRYERLVIKEMSHMKNHRSYWLCQCDCGNTIVTRSDALKSGATKSCGCWQKEQAIRVGRLKKKDITGQRFGKLVALYTDQKYNGCYAWECRCDCGKTTIVPISHLMSGHTKSCGNCQNRANGRMASFPQSKIAEMFDGVLNYRVDTKYIDIAFPDQKIAIEYDGWYWHKDKIQDDLERNKELISKGWKILRIKSSSKIPQKSQIQQKLNQLSPDIPYQEIILSDWGKGITSFQLERISNV